MNNLQGINFDTKLNVDDLKFFAQVMEDAILSRTIINSGKYSGLDVSYGIIDQMDPKDLIDSDTTRPLLVVPSTIDPLRVNVNSGAVVCPNGSIVVLSESVSDFELSNSDVDDTVVLLLENEMIISGQTTVSKFGTAAKSRYTQSEDKLRSFLLSDYNNPSLFPPSRKENVVVIAVIRVASTTELLLDYTSNTYSFNRPWFSLVDSQHRAFKGSGEATARNPHGTTFNDLSTGSIPFYSQIYNKGAVFSRDGDIKGRSGYACVETIDPSAIKNDSTGNVTSISRFGGIDAKYIELSNFPTSIGSAHLNTHKSLAVSFDWIKGTKIVVIPDSEVFSTPISIYYNRVNALEIPNFINGNKFSLNQVDLDNEFIVSGGLSFSNLPNTEIEFDGSGPIARKYKVFLNDNGDLIKFPQILQNVLPLDSIGSEFKNLEVNQFGPAQLSIGLVDAIEGSNLNVTIRIFGTNEQGVVITEDLKFDSSWTSYTLPSTEDIYNLVKTKNVFTSLTGYQVIERVSDGNSSKIIIYAEIESGTATRLNSLALVADVDWDGVSIGNIRDKRDIIPFFDGYKYKYGAAASLFDNSNLDYILTEEYNAPKYQDVTPDTQAATAAKTKINFTDDISSGDTIQLSPSKTIAAVTGTPNRSIGQFKIGTASETRNDALLTIQDINFDSGYTVVSNGTTSLDITSKTLGTRGNKTVTINTTIPQAITKDGNATGGYDSFGEIVVPHHCDRLSSIVPSLSTYDVSNIKNRYMSRAIPIDYKSIVKILIHGIITPYSGVQIRYRIASDDILFGQWIPLNVNSPLITITSTNITKIQIELFGECDGFSIFEG